MALRYDRMDTDGGVATATRYVPIAPVYRPPAVPPPPGARVVTLQPTPIRQETFPASVPLRINPLIPFPIGGSLRDRFLELERKRVELESARRLESNPLAKLIVDSGKLPQGMTLAQYNKLLFQGQITQGPSALDWAQRRRYKGRLFDKMRETIQGMTDDLPEPGSAEYNAKPSAPASVTRSVAEYFEPDTAPVTGPVSQPAKSDGAAFLIGAAALLSLL